MSFLENYCKHKRLVVYQGQEQFSKTKKGVTMTHEIITSSVDRISRPAALTMGAFLVGGLVELGRSINEKRQPVVSGVTSYHEDEGPSFLFFRGCGENYQTQAPLFHRKLSGHGSLHFEYQTSGLHIQDDIDQHVIEVCKADGERDRVLVCTSMGLMNAMKSLMNPAVREALGENRLQAVISRSGITSKYDLQPNMQQAAAISSRVPALPTVGDMWQMHRLRRAHRVLSHSERTSDEEALLHHESSAYMPFSLVASQHRQIHESTPFEENSHNIVAKENPDLRLYQITAEYDAVADWQKTNTSLERSFGLPVETIIDERRPHGSHADDLEYIEPLESLVAQLGRRNKCFMAAVANLEMPAWSDPVVSAA